MIDIENARKLGTERGKREAEWALANDCYGEPRAPLSGEFAGDPTPQSVLAALGINWREATESNAVLDWHWHLLEEYEDAYYDAWEEACPNE